MDRTRRRARNSTLCRRVAAAAAVLLAAACTGPRRAPGPIAAATATTAPARPAEGEPRYLVGWP